MRPHREQAQARVCSGIPQALQQGSGHGAHRIVRAAKRGTHAEHPVCRIQLETLAELLRGQFVQFSQTAQPVRSPQDQIADQQVGQGHGQPANPGGLGDCALQQCGQGLAVRPCREGAVHACQDPRQPLPKTAAKAYRRHAPRLQRDKKVPGFEQSVDGFHRVTRATSSNVVRPPRASSSAASRKNRVPVLRACSLIAVMGALLVMSSRRASSMRRISAMAVRPL